MLGQLRFALTLAAAVFATACSTIDHPCSEGGDPAWDAPLKSPGGDKHCEQAKDSDGKWWNHGKYVEWYPDGTRALQGTYKWGRKDWKWEHWTADGKKDWIQWWDNGVRVKNRVEKADQNGDQGRGDDRAVEPAQSEPTVAPSPAADATSPAPK